MSLPCRLFQVELQRDEDSIFADDAVFVNSVGAAIDYDREKVMMMIKAERAIASEAW